MSYGRAERNLALIRQLEAETRQLLEGFPRHLPRASIRARRCPVEAVVRVHCPRLGLNTDSKIRGRRWIPTTGP
jgi:hypothetical protein